MMRRLWIFPTVLIGVWRLVACTGSDPEIQATSADAGSIGELGGKCFSDNKCKEGLECADGIVCVRPGDVVEGGEADAGLDAIATPNDAAPCLQTWEPIIEGLTVTNQASLGPCVQEGKVGCRKGAEWTCDTFYGCEGYPFKVECSEPSHCTGTTKCCVNVTSVDRATCPPTAERLSPTTVCRTECFGTELRLCTPGSPCSAQGEECRRVDLLAPTSPGAELSVNVCLPPP